MNSHPRWALILAACFSPCALLGCAVQSADDASAAEQLGQAQQADCDGNGDHDDHADCNGQGDGYWTVADSEATGPIDAQGAFTCDFRIAGDFPPQDLPGRIEADRMLMAAGQLGMLHKQIPVNFDATFTTNGAPDFDSGGRYLFRTSDSAKAYHQFVNDLVIDGVPFLQRPYFFAPFCEDWSVIHAEDFAPVHSNQVVIRTERFSVPKHVNAKLESKWHQIRQEAKDRNFASAWLLYNEDDQLVSLVYTIDRVVPKDPNVPDFATLGAMQSAQPLGDVFDGYGWTRVFDRTSWILTVWYPYVARDQGQASDWPASPPFPEPYCGDGTCEISQGETSASCAADCPSHCGDGVCQSSEGESDVNCPSDCRLEDQGVCEDHDDHDHDHGWH